MVATLADDILPRRLTHLSVHQRLKELARHSIANFDYNYIIAACDEGP